MRLSRRAALLGAMVMSTPAHAQTVKVKLGTATPGGGFPVYGEAFVAAIKAEDPALEIEAVNTKGSTENVPMLEAGTLDIALVQGEVVHEALSGIGRPPASLKILTAMYPTAGLFVVRSDSPYRRITDLKGKPVAWGAAGSGLVILGRYVMDGLGLDAAKDFQPVYLEKAGDGPAMVLDGRVAALWGGGAGWPGFKTVMASQEGGPFVAPDAGEIQRILAKHKFLKPISQPAGSYPGQSAAIPSVGSWSFVMARPGLDPAIAARLAKALHQAEAKPSPQLGETTAKKHACRCDRSNGAASRRAGLLSAGGPQPVTLSLLLRSIPDATRKEPDMQDTSTNKTPKDGVEGEGSYSGTREYNERTAKFIKEGKVDKAAKEAERAMDSDEAADLKKAEAQGKAGDIHGKRKSK